MEAKESKNKNFRNSIEQAKTEFDSNSIKISKKPFFLERLDKYNFCTYVEKKTKVGNLVNSEYNYFGRLDSALKHFLSLLIKKPINEIPRDTFTEYKDIKPLSEIKEQEKIILNKLNKLIREFKSNKKKRE